jgi:hypothetical protein
METKIFNIDSRFRNKQIYPNSANYVFNRLENNINSTYNDFNEKNIISIKINSIELPNSIYFIQNARGNNKLLLNNIPIYVPDGSYTYTELIDYLQNNVIELPNINFVYNSATYKVTITNNSGFILSFPDNTINQNYLSLGKLLGFDILSIPSNGLNYIGTNAMRELYEPYIFLSINDYGNIYNNNNNKPYVAKIFTNKDSKFISQNNEDNCNFITHKINFEQPININVLKISLRDMFNNPINLNGNEWIFTIEMTIISNSVIKNYEEFPFYNDQIVEKLLIRKMLKYYTNNQRS